MDAVQTPLNAAMRRSLEPVYGDDGLCIASWGPLLVGVWWRHASARDMQTFRDAQSALIADKGVVSTLMVLRHKLALAVDEDVREGGTRTARELGPSTLGSVTVIEETGMRANFYRSVVTGIYLTARTQTKHKVVSSIRDGVNWVTKLPGSEARLQSEAELIAKAIQDLADRNA